MKKLGALLLASAILSTTAFQSASADGWHGHGDIHHFHDYDYGYWRGGFWSQGFHDGRMGWWWVVGPSWYYYPAPVYPYPDPYIPPGVVVEHAPSAVVSAAPSYVYFCREPAGYYPYVAQCFRPWQRVLTTSSPSTVVVQTTQQPTTSAPPALPVNEDSMRTADDRQLNAFAVELQDIDAKDKHARAHLKDLEKRVEAYRQTLYNRQYNAMDILRDAENLQKRIHQQIENPSKTKKDTEESIVPIPPTGTETPPPDTMAPPAPSSSPVSTVSPTDITSPPPQ